MFVLIETNQMCDTLTVTMRGAFSSSDAARREMRKLYDETVAGDLLTVVYGMPEGLCGDYTAELTYPLPGMRKSWAVMNNAHNATTIGIA